MKAIHWFCVSAVWAITLGIASQDGGNAAVELLGYLGFFVGIIFGFLVSEERG